MLEPFSYHSIRDYSEFQKKIKYGIESKQTPLDLQPNYYPPTENIKPNKYIKKDYNKNVILLDINKKNKKNNILINNTKLELKYKNLLKNCNENIFVYYVYYYLIILE